MPRPVHFEIHADDPERAIAFYGQAFGWSFHKWDGPMPYWLVTTGPDERPGINGGLLQRQGGSPADGGVNAFPCTLDVSSVDDALAAVTGAGGTVVMPKEAIPGIGWLAYAKDPEGNLFGMMQDDSSAQ
jgi:predicted enzyme related to lactoylglutathione lyase